MCAKPLAVEDSAYVPADGLPLFHREVRERLSPTALTLLLDRAEIFVEGAAVKGSSARGAFLGSALFTLDLSTCERLRPRDTAAAERLRTALQDDDGARRTLIARALEIARARLAVPAKLTAKTLSLRCDGTRVLVDLELEGSER